MCMLNFSRYAHSRFREHVDHDMFENGMYETYINETQSMAKYLDHMMLKETHDWFSGWRRTRFPLQVDRRKVELTKIIANEFCDFIGSIRDKDVLSYSIDEKRYQRVVSLKKGIEEDERREQRNFMRMKRETRKYRTSFYKKRLDKLYKRWMKHVNEKEMSSSYRSIHEYVMRHMVEYGKQHDWKHITPDRIWKYFYMYKQGKSAKTITIYKKVFENIVTFLSESE